jgi:hypothetical protein
MIEVFLNIVVTHSSSENKSTTSAGTAVANQA